jgi:ankyrin repeat protein
MVTPLHNAAGQGHAEVTKLLVHAKSDIAARDWCGEFARRARVRCCAAKPHALPCSYGRSPLIIAIDHTKSDVVAFLRSAGALE